MSNRKSGMVVPHGVLPRCQPGLPARRRTRCLAPGLSLCLAVLLAMPATVLAEPRDLLAIYRLALERDQQLNAARHRFRAAEEIRPQARALFLPEISLEAETGYTWESAEFGRESVNGDFSSWTAGIALTQPLFRLESFSASRQADVLMDQASLQLGQARQDLLLRSGQAYFDILLAQDRLQTIDAELAAIDRELRRAERAREVGVGTITAVNEAQARFDRVQADRLAGENTLTVAGESLRRLIHEPPGQLRGLEEDFEAEMPQPAQADAWAERAQRSNLGVRLADQNLELAREGIARERAGRYPQVDLVARYGRTYQSELGAQAAQTPMDPTAPVTPDASFETEQITVGVNVSMLLYTGGARSARIRELRSERDAVFSDTLDVRRQAALEAESAYLNLTSNLRRIQALEQALLSIRSTEESTQRGLEVGLRTTLDVLDVQRERFEVERQLAEARYTYLLTYLQLQVAVGAGIDEQPIRAVNAFLNREGRDQD